MESILTSIKKLLGITEDYTHFDSDLVIHINSAFAVLTQLGAGPKEGFLITDKSAVWKDFIQDDTTIEFVKSYVHLKVRLMFDPPTMSSVESSIERMLSEFEWRIMAACEK